MIKRTTTFALCFVIQLFLVSSLAAAQTAGAPSPQTEAAFTHLVDRYFDFYFQASPTAATQAGFHQYDSKLEDFSHSAMEAEIAGLTKFRKQFNGMKGP